MHGIKVEPSREYKPNKQKHVKCMQQKFTNPQVLQKCYVLNCSSSSIYYLYLNPFQWKIVTFLAVLRKVYFLEKKNSPLCFVSHNNKSSLSLWTHELAI